MLFFNKLILNIIRKSINLNRRISLESNLNATILDNTQASKQLVSKQLGSETVQEEIDRKIGNMKYLADGDPSESAVDLLGRVQTILFVGHEKVGPR